GGRMARHVDPVLGHHTGTTSWGERSGDHAQCRCEPCRNGRGTGGAAKVNQEPRRGADVPPPPRPVAPTVWSLPEGTQLFMVHPLEVESVPVVPGSFPPGRAQRASRFAPLGSGVGVLYAATSALGVLTEDRKSTRLNSS